MRKKLAYSLLAFLGIIIWATYFSTSLPKAQGRSTNFTPQNVWETTSFEEQASSERSHNDMQSAPNRDSAPEDLLKSGNIDIKATSIPLADDVLYHHLTVVAHQQEIFSDTANLFTSNKGVLPIVRELSTNRYEILLGLTQSYEHSLILRLIIDDHAILQRDTLPMFDGNRGNLDSDDAIEFAGFLDPLQAYCQDCDSTYYNPLLIYEMNDKGFTFDSIATYDWIMARYGVFHGFKPQSDLIVPISKQPSSRQKIVNV